MAIVDNRKDQFITSEAQLRQRVPAYPKILDKRIRPELDRYCLELINFSTLVIAAYSDSNCPMEILSAKDVVVADGNTIVLSPSIAMRLTCDGCYASLYFMVPGVGHGLRVNGVVQHHDSQLVFKIKSTYLHCARAAARSDLWNSEREQGPANTTPPMLPEQFLAASSYLLMKTMNVVGETELSPRGDQGRVVYSIGQSRLLIPERPGNKVAVSLRNILKNNKVELLMLIPETDLIMHVSGHASITENKQLLDLAIVNNKRPKLAILMDQCCFFIAQSHAIQQTKPWLDERHVRPGELTRFSKALSAHMSGEGFIGKATTPFVDAIVKKDMRNLY